VVATSSGCKGEKKLNLMSSGGLRLRDVDKAGPHRRATYILEMGVWRATCRTCSHTVTDPRRRQAAALFRNHTRDADQTTELDLRSAPDEPETTRVRS
jgi:hypothetical protein